MCVSVCVVSGKVNPKPCGDDYPTLRNRQPFCQLEKELSGEDRACCPSRSARETTCPLEMEAVILAGVPGLLGCGTPKDWWQEKVLGDPVSGFKLLD